MCVCVCVCVCVCECVCVHAHACVNVKTSLISTVSEVPIVLVNKNILQIF